MVLWEITVATAYFLGLKRTYKLALRIQRRIISPNHPKIREFAHRRTRAVFDVASKVHQNIQQRDIQVGRNLGDFILRWLDRMKPSARICAGRTTTDGANSSVNMVKHANATGTSNHKPRASDRHLFGSSSIIWPKPFPTTVSMMRPSNPAGTTFHGRHVSMFASQGFGSNYRVNWPGDVIRKDIMQWMLQN